MVVAITIGGCVAAEFHLITGYVDAEDCVPKVNQARLL